MASPEIGSLTGMTAHEAQEFHKSFVSGFLGFSAIALVAHILVWLWKPWIPNDDGVYSSLIDGAPTVAAALTALV